MCQQQSPRSLGVWEEKIKFKRFESSSIFLLKQPILLPKLVRDSLYLFVTLSTPSSCFIFSALGELGELLREGETGVIHKMQSKSTAVPKKRVQTGQKHQQLLNMKDRKVITFRRRELLLTTYCWKTI